MYIKNICAQKSASALENQTTFVNYHALEKRSISKKSQILKINECNPGLIYPWKKKSISLLLFLSSIGLLIAEAIS